MKNRNKINEIFKQQAARVADMFKVSEEHLTVEEKIAYLHEVAAETSNSPLAVSVISSEVRALVGDKIYRSVFPLPVYE